MKKFLLFLVAVIGVAAVHAQKTINDPNAEVRNVSGFHAIKVSHAIDLYLSQSATETVAVSAAEEKYRDRIRTTVEDGVLKIWFDNDNNWKMWNTNNKKLKAYVSFKEIDKLIATGASDVMVDGSIKANSLTIELSGASDFKGQVSAGNLVFDQSGASDATVTGQASTLKIGVSGASSFKGYDLLTDNCNARASGASDIKITVNKELNARASGASKIVYKGDGVIRELNTSGASSINKRS
ncbi:MAG TPA: head GIN domain-containing protein [Chitinophagaceae bacterium]